MALLKICTNNLQSVFHRPNNQFQKSDPNFCCLRLSQAGFTIFEVMIVIALFTIIAALGLFMNLNNLRDQAFRNDQIMTINTLQRARSLAIYGICFGDEPVCNISPPHGVHFSANGMILFQGDHYLENDPNNEKIDFDSKLTQITSTSASNIIFDRISGNLISENNATTSSVILTNNSGKTSAITINSEGRIDWTN